MIKIPEKCDKNPNVISVHKFMIIKGSGKIMGIPQWECVYCNKTVIAS